MVLNSVIIDLCLYMIGIRLLNHLGRPEASDLWSVWGVLYVLIAISFVQFL